MPLYREWSSDPYSLAAIWEIKEPEDFFLQKTQLEIDIKNEKRRIEHLAGRFLLKYLENDFPILNIKPDHHDKPRLEDNKFYFSISHSYPYVAAVVSPYVECGIDIQVWHHRMEQLQHKFLSDLEQQFFQQDPRLLTLAWCAKEAAYKWQGRRGVEFIDHLVIQNFLQNSHDYQIDILLKLLNPELLVSAKGLLEDSFACSVIVNKRIF